MKRALYAVLLAASPVFAADLVARNGTDSLRLTGESCPAAVLALIPPEYHEAMRKAVAHVRGQKWVGCYLVVGDMVLVQYDDGETGAVPLALFDAGL